MKNLVMNKFNVILIGGLKSLNQNGEENHQNARCNKCCILL